MPDPYAHGHHESVLRSHRWRTAENSAAYLLPALAPGVSMLDVGAGPGTITLDLAERVAPGPVRGVDASADVVTQAEAARVASGLDNASFAVDDAYALDSADGAWDVVHAHQVLQHLVRVHDIPRPVCRVEGIGVVDGEARIVEAGCHACRLGLRDDVGRGIHPAHGTRGDPLGEIERDRARSRTDVEHAHPRREGGQQVGGRVLGGAPAVRAQHALVMAVGVGIGHGSILADRLTCRAASTPTPRRARRPRRR